MAFAAISAMVAAVVRDRVVGVGAVLAAGLILLTAWVLGVAAMVVLVAQKLGTAGALATVTAGLVLLAVVIVWVTRARNRSTAAQRSTTRALWVATAANAASTILRSDPRNPAAASPASAAAEAAPGSHRSALLIAGGLVLILLAFLFPSGKGEETAEGAEPGPDGPEAGPGPTA